MDKPRPNKCIKCGNDIYKDFNPNSDKATNRWKVTVESASWNDEGNVVLKTYITLPRQTISKRVASIVSELIANAENTQGKTLESVSQWLQDHGFEEASKALDVEFEL